MDRNKPLLSLNVPEPYASAHLSSFRNRKRIMKSAQVGCFYCETVFSPAEIKEWTDTNETAICPKCGIDSLLVMGESFKDDAGKKYKVDSRFLKRMHDEWFDVDDSLLDRLVVGKE